MRQSRTPDSRPPGPNVLGELAYLNVVNGRDAEVVFCPPRGGDWEDMTATQVLTEVTKVAKGLIAAGVARGDRVLVAAPGGYEQTLVALAVWAVGAVVVWAPGRCSPGLLRRVLRDSRPAVAVVRDRHHARVVASMQQELVDLGRTWTLDKEGLEAIARPGAYMDGTAVRFRIEESEADDPAVICYTLTPQRRIRGAVLSHRNLLTAAQALVWRLSPVLDGGREQHTTLLGPHTEGAAGYAVVVAGMLAGARVGFTRPGEAFLAQAKRFAPTVLVADAADLRFVYERERGRAHEGGWDGAQGFETATRLAVELDQKKGRRKPWQRVSRAIYDWVFARVKDAVGGRVHAVVCVRGGLEPRLTHFYAGAGMPVLEGFGLAQTGGLMTLNVPGEHRPGTLGPAVDGVEVKISEHGEVLVRGASVFTGYHNAVRESDQVLRDGWLATGWLGELDEADHLVVHGPWRPEPPAARTPAVQAPQRPTAAALPAAEDAEAAPDHLALETRLLSHPLISQAIVLGEGRPYATALITLKRDQLEYWRLVNGYPLSTPLGQIAVVPELGAEIRRAVEEVNSSVPPESMIRAFHVLPEEFSPASGLLLPSGRLRRDAVLRAFAEEIEALYSDPPEEER